MTLDRSRLRQIVSLLSLAFISVAAFSDEWKPRHALVPPTGVINLPSVAGPQDVLLPGPENPRATASWLAGLKSWRQDRLTRLGYDNSEYARPELAWTQRTFSQVQLLIWDRTFYDPETREYTVDKFLADTESRIGPIDAVLIWPVYPNLGVDDRNQFDLLRDMPGGLPGVRKMVDDFHHRNVKVFFPTLAWDSRAPATKAPHRGKP